MQKVLLELNSQKYFVKLRNILTGIYEKLGNRHILYYKSINAVLQETMKILRIFVSATSNTDERSTPL
jgi:hypothetical protein